MNAKRTKGFTIAEMVLAISIASVIGLSVAVVSMALSTANEHSQENDVYVQTARSVIRSMEATIRKSKLVVAKGAGLVVLWSDDADGNGLINISELQVLGYNGPAQRIELTRVVFPDTMDESTRTVLDDDYNLKDLMDVAKVPEIMVKEFPSYRQVTTLAENVLGVSYSTDQDPPKTRVVKFKVQVGTPASNVTLYGAAALRADRTSWLVPDGDKYILIPPE